MNKFLSSSATMIWIREKNIQNFMEEIWVQAFVDNDSCIKSDCEFYYDFNWDSNILTIQPYDENEEPYVKITHNLALYLYAFDIMKQEIMSVISTGILPDYLKNIMLEKDYQFLTNMTHFRHNNKNLYFTYFDNLNNVGSVQTFNFPEFYYWYKHTSVYDIVFRDTCVIHIPNFMEKIYYNVCQRMENNPNPDTTNTVCWEHIKECFYETFPSAEYLDEIMTENKDILSFHEESVSIS